MLTARLNLPSAARLIAFLEGQAPVTTRVRSQRGFDLPREGRLRSGQGFVRDGQRFVERAVFPVDQHIFQQGIGRIENRVRKMHLVPKADLDGALDTGHRNNV